LGLENSIWVSFNDGDAWQPLQNNLPYAPVHDITVQEHFNDLVLATYGRGFWIMDDITPLQQLTAEVAAKDVHLFLPRAAYRFRGVEAPMTASYDPVTGQNPQYGASINYWLKTPPTDSVTLTVLDPAGKEVRQLKAMPKTAGINRITWDLQTEPTKAVVLRTAPLYAPYVAAELAGRPSASLRRHTMLVPPGRYAVRLTAGGHTETQPLEVRKDPNTAGTEADLRTQAGLATEMRSELDGVVDMVNTIEVVRTQLATLKSVTKDEKEVGTAADSLEQKFIAVEEQLTQLRITGRGQDLIRYPAKVGEKMIYLLGDVVSTDNGPTGPQREVGGVLKDRARSARNELDRLINRDLEAFNKLLQGKGLGGIIAKPAARIS
jgi:hypothetical protein